MNLGERIYRLRTEKKLSQNDLAELLNVSRQSISKWENNNAMPDLEKAVKLSEILGVTLDELVKGRDELEKTEADNTLIMDDDMRTHEKASVEQKRDGERTPLCKIAGVILLCMSLFLGVIMMFGTGSILGGIILMSPFLLCGIACLKAEQHLGLWCCWAMYFSVDMFLRYGNVSDWTQVFYDTARIGSSRWFIVWAQFLGLVGMVLWTIIGLRQSDTSRKEELGKVCGLSWGIFGLALIFAKMGNQIINQIWDKTFGLYDYLLGRYCFGLLDWIRISAFTLAAVSTVRYLYALKKT